MEQIQLIPKEILYLIPKYDGEENLLNFFIQKCEYVVTNFRGAGTPAQSAYIYQCISCRLSGKAAVLVSERNDLTNWEQLRALLTQHFGDPRSEQCIKIELESLRIKPQESFVDFCKRVQALKSSLFAKVNLLTDEGIKAARMIIYNDTALNVFLNNLPKDIIRIIRRKEITTLENALSIVMEEENFMTQYNAFNNIAKPKPVPQQQQLVIPNNTNFKFGIPNNAMPRFIPQQPNQFVQNKFNPQNKFVQPSGFKFGNPQNPGFRQNPQPNQSFNKFGFNNFRNQPNSNFKFGIHPQPQPQQNLNRPQNFNNNQAQGFRFGIPLQQRPPQQTDVSMRTARNNYVNDSPDELTFQNDESENIFYSNELQTNNDLYNTDFEQDGYSTDNHVEIQEIQQSPETDQNFYTITEEQTSR